MRRRILWVGESSFLNTGYSVIAREMLTRLHHSGKYDITEIGCYGSNHDPRSQQVPWRFIGNLPVREEERNQYESHPLNQFGAWKFDEVVLQLKPDVVFDVRDPWMCSFQRESPFRDFFYWGIMPAVDSLAQDPSWLETYSTADGVFGYTHWALNVLRKESNNHIKCVSTTSPAANTNIFRPVQNKRAYKENFFGANSVVFGTVMRNQKRKLYDDLIKSFEKYIELCIAKGNQGLADRSYLYIHTSVPDAGWNIPRILTESSVAHKIIFTYVCKQCRHVEPKIFCGPLTPCARCGGPMIPPNVQTGVDDPTLAQIYNIFDLYIQYSICLPEGEKVLLESGWTNIEDVSIDDNALTHSGRYLPVINKFKRHVNETLKEVVVKDDYDTLRLTEEHPVYAICAKDIELKGNPKNVRSTLGYLLRNGYKTPVPKFVAANELAIGDMIAYPIDDYVNDISSIDLIDFALRSEECTIDMIKIRNGHWYPRYIEIDDDFCKFIGLFAADGSTEDGVIKLTFATHEKEHIEISSRVIKKISGKEPVIIPYTDREAVDVCSYSTLLERAFSFWFDKKENRKLPNWSLHLPKNKQLQIVFGMFMGDGWNITKGKGSGYSTVSEDLASNLKLILRRLRVNFNCNIWDRENEADGKNRKPSFKFEVQCKLKDCEFSNDRSSTDNLYLYDFHLLKISDIRDIEYQGYVYNFEVKYDNSYVTKIGAVHNCEGLGMPQVEAAACGVPVLAVDFSGMDDVIKRLGAISIPILKIFREAETQAYRVYPNDDVLVEKLYEFAIKPDILRYKMGMDARRKCVEEFSWDKNAEIWMEWIDGLPDKSHLWNSPARLFSPNTNIPQIPHNDDFIRWCITNIAGRPDLLDGYMHMVMLRDLNQGMSQEFYGGMVVNEDAAIGSKTRQIPFDRNSVVQKLLNMRNKINQWEMRRCQMYGIPF